MLDAIVHGHELGHAGDVETGADIVKGFYDRRVAVRLDGEIDLGPRQVLAELGVVLAQDLVVHHDERRAVALDEPQERLLIHAFTHSGDRSQGSGVRSQESGTRTPMFNPWS